MVNSALASDLGRIGHGQFQATRLIGTCTCGRAAALNREALLAMSRTSRVPRKLRNCDYVQSFRLDRKLGRADFSMARCRHNLLEASAKA